MKKTEITIVTSYSSALGSGHIQRMLSLAEYLEEHKKFSIKIVSPFPHFFSGSGLDRFFSDEINGSSLIIRDMRDSTIDEIGRLKSKGKTVVVDDLGKGRDFADSRIDLLPNHLIADNRDFRPDCFIFGRNFVYSLKEIKETSIEKKYDFVLYAGSEPSDEKISMLMNFIPEKYSGFVLAGEKSFFYKKGKKISAPDMNYSMILLSSRVLISHFGIMNYEADVSGCSTVSINPSKYHSTLADIAGKEMKIFNLGVEDEIVPETARTLISEAVENHEKLLIDPETTVNNVLEKTRNFEKFLVSML